MRQCFNVVETISFFCFRESKAMNRKFRLTLCLAALCALPAMATAQGFLQPGMANPNAGTKNDDRRDSSFFPGGVHVYVPQGVPGPTFAPNDRSAGFPRARTGSDPAATASQLDQGHFPRNFAPETAEAFRPLMPPETLSQFPEPIRIPGALAHTAPIPRFTSEMPALTSGAGRGLGLLGGVGAGIAGLFRAIFGRRKG
jgi:hypothetical protein